MFISIASSVFSKSEFNSAKEPKRKKIYIKSIICSVFPPRLYLYLSCALLDGKFQWEEEAHVNRDNSNEVNDKIRKMKKMYYRLVRVS